jgi:hypothetical protein
MKRTVRIISTMLAVLAAAGCATMHTGLPQTREKFVSDMKAGGLFTNTETTTVGRPAKAVMADITEYANKCLNVRVSTGPVMKYRSAGGSTAYLTKMENAPNGVMALSVQEEYNDRPQSGSPPGGLYVFVSEIRPSGVNKTDINIHYLTARGKIGDFLKQWANGNKSRCPNLDRVV